MFGLYPIILIPSLAMNIPLIATIVSIVIMVYTQFPLKIGGFQGQQVYLSEGNGYYNINNGICVIN
jgi:hypothetical protein